MEYVMIGLVIAGGLISLSIISTRESKRENRYWEYRERLLESINRLSERISNLELR